MDRRIPIVVFGEHEPSTAIWEAHTDLSGMSVPLTRSSSFAISIEHPDDTNLPNYKPKCSLVALKETLKREKIKGTWVKVNENRNLLVIDSDIICSATYTPKATTTALTVHTTEETTLKKIEQALKSLSTAIETYPSPTKTNFKPTTRPITSKAFTKPTIKNNIVINPDWAYKKDFFELWAEKHGLTVEYKNNNSFYVNLNINGPAVALNYYCNSGTFQLNGTLSKETKYTELYKDLTCCPIFATGMVKSTSPRKIPKKPTGQGKKEEVDISETEEVSENEEKEATVREGTENDRKNKALIIYEHDLATKTNKMAPAMRQVCTNIASQTLNTAFDNISNSKGSINILTGFLETHITNTYKQTHNLKVTKWLEKQLPTIVGRALGTTQLTTYIQSSTNKLTSSPAVLTHKFRADLLNNRVSKLEAENKRLSKASAAAITTADASAKFTALRDEVSNLASTMAERADTQNKFESSTTAEMEVFQGAIMQTATFHDLKGGLADLKGELTALINSLPQPTGAGDASVQMKVDGLVSKLTATYDAKLKDQAAVLSSLMDKAQDIADLRVGGITGRQNVMEPLITDAYNTTVTLKGSLEAVIVRLESQEHEQIKLNIKFTNLEAMQKAAAGFDASKRNPHRQ
jgi:hypothetical protein